MLNDEVLSGLTWGDLEQALGEMACPAKSRWVAETTSALWHVSQFYPESLTLLELLKAGAWLASPELSPGSADGPPSPS